MDEPSHGTPHEAHVGALLARAVARARGSLLWERLWPALAALANALGLFLAFSWAGLWTALPPLGRAVGLGVFALVTLVAAIPLIRLRLPSVSEGLRRLDRGSGEAHRPATAIADRIATNGEDPVAQALWRAHVERALTSARKFKAGWPRPMLPLRDPLALRALVLLLVVTTFFAAAGERWKRVLAAFDWSGVVAPANFRIDAWITPPVYTGRAPILLPGLHPGASAPPASSEPVAVPAGSQLVIRASGVHVKIAHDGGVEDAPPAPTAEVPQGSEEHRFVIRSDGAATVHGAGGALGWRFTAIPDRAPSIELIREPERQARGALRLDYRVADDYGVTDAQATFTLKDEESAKPNAHPLFGPPNFPLSLPQARTRGGAAQTIHDLTEHPWAGADVVMTLVAHDEVGNEGRSEPHQFQLPARVFAKPLARALIEQRRLLAFDANAKPLVLTALDALAMAPEKFSLDAGVYLGLRSIYYDLKHARSDDQLREVVARLWEMATQIEDGNIAQAEQALRAAQDALRQALERGASDEELRKLMDDLRAAMDRFLQALAEQLKKSPEQLARPLDPNTRVLSQRDLQSMLDRIERLARSGNKEAAQRLLEQLQSMLENLQLAQPNAGDDLGDDMNSALDELGDMIRKQQQLRDKTFKQGQDMRRDRAPGDQRRQRLGDLKQDQQALRERLKKLLDQLRQHGLTPGQKQPGEQAEQGGNEMDQLGEADAAMGNAESALGEGDADDAVDSQGKALDAMRKGAQGLAQAMQDNGYGPGPNGRPGGPRPRAENDTDPLGRPLRGRDLDGDSSVKVPGEIDAQRARRILEELRRRLGESFRPQLELDYIERLLKGF
ncbi:MAG: TIGR02302 family protein [Pseudolabrys sp.]|nr:TIGR02302 family protein [Pseudolabrys sp.]